MYNHIAEIQKHPVCSLISFHLLADVSGLAELLLNVVRKSLNLAPVGSVCNDEIVCKDRDGTDINDPDILCLLILQCLERQLRHFRRYLLFHVGSSFAIV